VWWTGPVDTGGWAQLLDWYDSAARDLPWRAPGRSPWGVLVSEVMLQQTPVARVVPVYEAWLARWPEPGSLAGSTPGDAVRVWNRLGYPRRALRLREAGLACIDRHDGQVPDDPAELLALPGVGPYTASAVGAFAFGRRCAVVDVNVARVVRRAGGGVDDPRPATRADRDCLQRRLPTAAGTAVRVSAALMELGALVCTARAPDCASCPWRERCAWHAAGRPPVRGNTPRQPPFPGSDRQVRGRLLALLREAPGPVGRDVLESAWATDPPQRERALSALVADGLAVRARDGWALPGDDEGA